MPSEKLLEDKTFMGKYNEHFDLVFFSPPYYDLEKYPSNNQSITKYKTYDDWLNKYWRPTVELCFHVLKTEGSMCYIVSNYGSINSNRHYNLVKDMGEIVKEIFSKKISTIPLNNKQKYVLSMDKDPEQIIMVRK